MRYRLALLPPAFRGRSYLTVHRMPPARATSGRTSAVPGRCVVDIVLVRFFLIVFVTFTCYWLRPFGPDERINAVIGAILGAAIIIFEWRLHRVSLKRLIGAAMGSILGIFGAYLFALIIHNS